MFAKQRKDYRMGNANSLYQFETISREISRIETEIYDLNVQKADVINRIKL